MWGFVDCTRYYLSFGIPKVVLHEATMVVGTQEKLGLLVPPGGGKSTIIRLLAGVDQPNSGYVLRDPGSIPLGYGGAFLAELTGEENIHNMASLLGVEPLGYSAFCKEFSELGDIYFQPLKLWTGAQRGRLAFASSLGAPATTYLADGKLVGGDRPFAEKCLAALDERLKRAGLILVASNPRITADVCDRHAVVMAGKIIMCASHVQATELFEQDAQEIAGEEMVDEELASFDLA